MTIASDNNLQMRDRLISLVGVSIAFLAPAYLCATKLGFSIVEPTAPAATYLNELAIWVVTLAVLGIVVFVERLPLKSIGLGRPTWEAICLGALCVAPLLVLCLATGAVLKLFGAAAHDDTSQAALILTMPLSLQLLIAMTAGFTEEILFRGYAIERVTLIVGSRWFGILLPNILFGAVHAPFWGLPHAFIAGMTGVWLTLIYVWRRNLWVCITAHAMLDAVLFIGIDINAAHMH